MAKVIAQSGNNEQETAVVALQSSGGTITAESGAASLTNPGADPTMRLDNTNSNPLSGAALFATSSGIAPTIYARSSSLNALTIETQAVYPPLIIVAGANTLPSTTTPGMVWVSAYGIGWMRTSGAWAQMNIPVVSYANRNGSPQTGELAVFTDRDNQQFYFDGTRWISNTIYDAQFQFNTATPFNTGITDSAYSVIKRTSLVPVELQMSVFQSGAGTASNYWSWAIDIFGIASGTTNTITHPGGSYVEYSYTSFTTVPTTPTRGFCSLTFTKNGSVANAGMFAMLRYRIAA